MQQPGQCHLGRSGVESAGCLSDRWGTEYRVLRVEGGAEWEERHIGHLVFPTCVEHVLSRAISQVECVLDAGHLCQRASETVGIKVHIAEADASDESLVAQSDHGLKLFGDWHVGVRMAAQVDDRNLVQLQ